MKDLNRVSLRGRIGSIKTFGRENNVAAISLVTKESYQDRNGNWQEAVTWHRVKAFSNNRNVPPFDFLKKGMTVQLEGKLSTNKYTDKDGNEKENIEVEALEMIIVDEYRDDNAQRGGNQTDYQDF